MVTSRRSINAGSGGNLNLLDSMQEYSDAEGSDWDASDSSAFDEYEPSEDDAEDDEDIENSTTAARQERNDEEEILTDIGQEDFSRLISAFQDEPITHEEEILSQRGKGNAWKQSMEADMESFHHELRDVNGYTRKNKSTRIREQALSPEVKALIAQANISYVEANLPAAIQQLEEVIRIEPTVKSAWYTLGMCFEELGEEEKSIQCRIVGAHLTSNASEEWRSLARRSRERGLLQQSIYCLQQVIKANRFDIDALWDRAVMLKDSGRLRVAADAFHGILKLRPYDAEILQELIPLLVSLGDYEIGADILEDMRRTSMRGAQDPNIDPALADMESTTGANVIFSLNELVTLADLLLLLKRPLQVILVVKQTIRWMRGQIREDRLDDAQNDLELDEVPAANVGDTSAHLQAYELDREVRLRLGKARFMLRDFEEGKRHFSLLIDETDPMEFPLLFLEMADTYFEYQLYAEALETYRPLLEEGLVDDVQVWIHMGMCYQNLNMLEEAAQVFEMILAEQAHQSDVKLSLAEIYEELGERNKALDLVNEVLAARHENKNNNHTHEAAPGPNQRPIEPPSSLSFFNESELPPGSAQASTQQRASRSGITYAERQRLEQQREEETRLAWIQLCALEPEVFVDGFWRHDFVFLDGLDNEPSSSSISGPVDAATKQRFTATRKWIQVAGRLIDSFRSMSLLFPKERHTKYRGVVRPRRSRQSKASDLDTQAEELLNRLRDQMVDEAMSDEAAGTQTSTNAAENFARDHNEQEQTTFRTIHFDDWVTLFMKYGIALAKVGNEDEAVNDMFRHVMVSNTVWPSEERKLSLHLCWLGTYSLRAYSTTALLSLTHTVLTIHLACALYSRDFARAFEIARWLPTTYQFHNEPLRLITSLANSLGFYGVDAFVSSTNTKQYQRRMRTHEAIIMGRPAKVNPRTGRWTMVGVDDDDEKGAAGTDEYSNTTKAQVPPTKSSPIGEIFYGYLMLCANSFQPAMGYLYRALALQQNDPLLCLLCCAASLGRATNRQVDNRNHTVIQGMSMLANYAELRGQSLEVDYNFGRAYQHLGTYINII